MPDKTPQDARILAVDEEEASLRRLERILRSAGYQQFCATTDPREFERLYADLQPDLILIGLKMPQVDGFGVLEALRRIVPQGGYLPVLVLTADALPATRKKALAAGAKDFLTKPVDPREVLLRVGNLLETRRLYLQLQDDKHLLEARVHGRTKELEKAQIEMLQRLALALESRDDDTGQHPQRVGRLAAVLGRSAGLAAEEAEWIEKAATLHDIGKIGIPDAILLKPGRLTEEEFEQIKTHTDMGARILTGSEVPILQLAEEIALYHHEKWDGTGYHGLAGGAIPLSARIVALADVFDVLTHTRCYKPAWPEELALEEIARQSGRHFDPNLAAIFQRGHWREDLERLCLAVNDGDEPWRSYRCSPLDAEVREQAVVGVLARR